MLQKVTLHQLRQNTLEGQNMILFGNNSQQYILCSFRNIKNNFKKRAVGICLEVSSADNLCKQLDPDQARQNVGPDLDPKCLTLIVLLKEF